jgi:hypothetical protein
LPPLFHNVADLIGRVLFLARPMDNRQLLLVAGVIAVMIQISVAKLEKKITRKS